MAFLKTFFKGTLVGIGGIAPGLSGSVLLVILGLYEKVVHGIGTLFSNFRKNICFLLPLLLGFGCGALLFSRIVDFLLKYYEFQTRYAFLGLVIGTVPLFYHEVKKKGFRKRYYFVMAAAAALGVALFSLNQDLFPLVETPNLLQSVLLGVAIAGSSIVPGIDSAVILSTLGLYELYVSSLANLHFQVLIPAAIGLAVGAVAISAVMNLLLKNAYTLTFSVIFGMFLSIIPNVLNESCQIRSVTDALVALGIAAVGFLASYYLGDFSGNNAKIRRLLRKISR